MIINTVSFHLHLLSNVINIEKYPFTKMMIDKEIDQVEYEVLFQLLHDLNTYFHKQKREGLLDYTSLLVHFAGMLNEKLHPDETILALKKEGYYEALMDVFLDTLEKAEKASSRSR